MLYHWSFLILDHDFYGTLKFKDIFDFDKKKNVVSERNYFYEREGERERKKEREKSETHSRTPFNRYSTQ